MFYTTVCCLFILVLMSWVEFKAYKITLTGGFQEAHQCKAFTPDNTYNVQHPERSPPLHIMEQKIMTMATGK